MCQRYQILSDLLINSMHFGVGKSYQNTKEVINMMNMHLGHDGLMGRALSALHSLTFGTLFLVVKRLFFLIYVVHSDQ